MAENITNLNSAGFQEAVSSSQLTLVDFWAPWCGPCKAIAPILEEVAQEMAGQVKIGKVNVDDEPEISAQYSIRAIPTLLLFKDGKTVDQIVGMTNKDDLVKRILANA
jgi:thioredoxin 1